MGVGGSGRGALDGVKVAEFAQHYAVPYCGQLLSDLGATVVKVEPPGGDNARHYTASHIPFESKVFAVINRGKRSVCVDLTKPAAARPAVEALVRWADVVLVSFKPPDVPRYGLSYDELASLNPRLVYLQHVPLGPEGPQADEGAFDPLVQAISGLSFLTARTEGGVPMNVRPAYNDAGVGMLSALGVVAALRHRDLTGEGQRVETHLLSTALAYTLPTIHRFEDIDPPEFEAFQEKLDELRAAGASFEEQRALYDDTVLTGRHLLRLYFRNWQTADGLVAAAPLSAPLQDKFHAATGLPHPRRHQLEGRLGRVGPAGRRGRGPVPHRDQRDVAGPAPGSRRALRPLQHPDHGLRRPPDPGQRLPRRARPPATRPLHDVGAAPAHEPNAHPGPGTLAGARGRHRRDPRRGRPGRRRGGRPAGRWRRRRPPGLSPPPAATGRQSSPAASRAAASRRRPPVVAGRQAGAAPTARVDNDRPSRRGPSVCR